MTPIIDIENEVSNDIDNNEVDEGYYIDDYEVNEGDIDRTQRRTKYKRMMIDFNENDRWS